MLKPTLFLDRDGIINAIKTAYIFFKKNIHLISFAIFLILYCIFVYRSYFNIFFEVQFAHIPFIEDLAKNSFNAQNFITIFGDPNEVITVVKSGVSAS